MRILLIECLYAYTEQTLCISILTFDTINEMFFFFVNYFSLGDDKVIHKAKHIETVSVFSSNNSHSSETYLLGLEEEILKQCKQNKDIHF